MKNLNRIFLVILLFIAFKSHAQTEDTTLFKDINLADPTIFYDNGTYYLYGTVEGKTKTGFLVYTSKDLMEWNGPKGANSGYALRNGDAYGDSGYWAPQVFLYKKKYYMAYTSNEHIAIAESNSPLGPFTSSSKHSIDSSVRQIDPFIFMDDDGKKYLYHVRLTNGNRLFVAEMTDDLTGIKKETLHECISAMEPWENTRNVKWPVSEGPTVIKHKGTYYFTYSTNDFRNPDYAVGYATSKSPLGPWVKYNKNPIISRNVIEQFGTGHGDFLIDNQGKLRYVFHTHFSAQKVKPRKTAIIDAAFESDKSTGTDIITVSPKSFRFLKVKKEN